MGRNRIRTLAILGMIVLLVLTGIQLLTNMGTDAQTIRAERGVLDLRGWDFKRDGTVALRGTWAFSPGLNTDLEQAAGTEHTQWVEVPARWDHYQVDGHRFPKYGNATYRLKVLLPPGAETLAVRTVNIKSAHKLIIDGHEIGRSGNPGTSRGDTKTWNVPYARAFTSGGDELDIVVQVANYRFYKGGMTHPIQLGDTNLLMTKYTRSLVLDAIVSIGVFLFGMYFMVLYSMRPQEKLWLFFGLFTVTGCLYMLVQGEKLLGIMLPSIPYELFAKLQFGSGACSMFFLLKYTQSSFVDRIPRKIISFVDRVYFTWFLLVLICPARVYSRFEWLYSLLVLMLVYFLYVLLSKTKANRRDDNLLLISLIISVFMILVVLYMVVQGMRISEFAMPLSILMFLLSQVLILSKRFTDSFRTVENLSERLLAADRMKDEFLAQTSHEMRTPLHGVINIAQSLMEGAAGSLNPQQSSNMSLIVSTGKRLSHLLNDILDMAKLKNNEVRLMPKPVELRPVVQAVLEVMLLTAGSKPIRLRNEVPECLGVRADEDRLMQVLYNLIGNAIKFTDQGEIGITARKTGDWIQISVQDTGIGIASDKLAAIFEPYEQANADIPRQYGGTGLGLTITKRLVELHGGSIQVQSVEGEGSIFSFAMPAELTPPTQQQEQAGLASSSEVLRQVEVPPRYQQRIEASAESSATVLVVDDDAANRQVLINLLSVDNYAVIAAASAAEALQEIAERTISIDLIILDMMMPGMNGYELTRLVRERFSLTELPIVMLTARSWPEDMLAGFDAGVNDFLGKPVDAGELRARIRTLIEMKRSANEKVRTEMAFLQAQIKPHFLYNTLNTIIAVSLTDVEKAQELLRELSGYLRGSFDFQNRERLVPIASELELVDSYLFIEQARFGDRLIIIRDIDEPLHGLIPPLTIQPIVENAVRHGVTKQPDGGTVRLSVWQEAEELIVEVADNGPGITPEQLPMLLIGGPGHGVGLVNIERRLRTMYGTGLDVKTSAGAGVTITFRLPLTGFRRV
ncbi:hybrid sensor histidine kinase/response regulator [Paenibacillus koleovorans]|uniref:hybrid sensor histidine kinase/response regulator n=1 Tax=Paenibacillus koleovorans TaxID=121608 RepID=UPI0013E3F2DE|nr:ATP-binding protein [Paenibacillus koleovorans]